MGVLAIPSPESGTASSGSALVPWYLNPDFEIGVVPEDHSTKHTRPFPLDRWGLFDPRALVPYMAEDRCAQLLTPREPGTCKEEFHHGVFPMHAFKKSTVPFALKRYRSSKYNQYLMLSCQEDLFHQDIATESPMDDLSVKSAERFVEEEGFLNEYVSTSWALAESRRRLTESKGFKIKQAFLEITEDVYQKTNAEALEKVKEIEVMSAAVVTGVLLQHLERQYEEGLAELVAQRLAADSLALVTRIYDIPTIRQMARIRFHTAVGKERLELRRVVEAAVAA